MILGTPVVLFRHLHPCRSLFNSVRYVANQNSTCYHCQTIRSSGNSNRSIHPYLIRLHHCRTLRHSCGSSGNAFSSLLLYLDLLSSLRHLRYSGRLPLWSEPLVPLVVVGPLALVVWPLAYLGLLPLLLVMVSCHILYSGAVLLSLLPHLMDFSDPLLHFAL